MSADSALAFRQMNNAVHARFTSPRRQQLSNSYRLSTCRLPIPGISSPKSDSDRGIFWIARDNFATRDARKPWHTGKRPCSSASILRTCWHRSCQLVSRVSTVFRALLLSIVLTLAAGQDGALLCDVWCLAGEMTGRACEHQTPTASPQLNANDNCTVSGNANAFVREDARRNTSAPTAQSGVCVPQFAFTPPASSSASAYEAAGRRPFDLRPLVFALRI